MESRGLHGIKILFIYLRPIINFMGKLILHTYIHRDFQRSVVNSLSLTMHLGASASAGYIRLRHYAVLIKAENLPPATLPGQET